MKTVIFFSGANCPKCKDVQKYWNDLVTENTGYNYQYGDTGKSLDLARKYKVMALPTILIIQGDKECTRMSGYLTKKIVQDKLREWVNKEPL